MPIAVCAVAINPPAAWSPPNAPVEDDSAGIFDIVTHDDEQRRGHARSVMASLYRGVGLGARYAYLQVNGDNEPARHSTASSGSRRYLYWYRGRETARLRLPAEGCRCA
jgi:hypothetical protein